jgi:hypothetical protein
MRSIAPEHGIRAQRHPGPHRVRPRGLLRDRCHVSGPRRTHERDRMPWSTFTSAEEENHQNNRVVVPEIRCNTSLFIDPSFCILLRTLKEKDHGGGPLIQYLTPPCNPCGNYDDSRLLVLVLWRIRCACCGTAGVKKLF